MQISSPTCHEAIPCESGFKGPRFFKVAVRPIIVWNLRVRVLIFHCHREQHVWRWTNSFHLLSASVRAFGFLTGIFHERSLLLFQFVLHYPAIVFSFLQSAQVSLCWMHKFQSAAQPPLKQKSGHLSAFSITFLTFSPLLPRQCFLIKLTQVMNITVMKQLYFPKWVFFYLVLNRFSAYFLSCS